MKKLINFKKMEKYQDWEGTKREEEKKSEGGRLLYELSERKPG